MATESGKKLFVGPRFRRIRQQLGLSQTQLAEGLGISPSYVNLIERNQRPVSAQILRSEEHTSELQSRRDLVCRLLLEKKKKKKEKIQKMNKKSNVHQRTKPQ